MSFGCLWAFPLMVLIVSYNVNTIIQYYKVIYLVNENLIPRTILQYAMETSSFYSYMNKLALFRLNCVWKSNVISYPQVPTCMFLEISSSFPFKKNKPKQKRNTKLTKPHNKPSQQKMKSWHALMSINKLLHYVYVFTLLIITKQSFALTTLTAL